MQRRKFIKHATAVAITPVVASATVLPACAQEAVASGLHIVGPMPGYTPHIGTLVSMLNYNRQTIIDSITGLSTTDLDFLIDAKANSIGALVLHLAAIEKIYQVTTFENRKGLNEKETKEWKAALDLGEAARQTIKGHPASYYLERIAAVRQETLSQLKKRDDQWLLATDASGNTNNYWKWFHVCEHESNHRGQIAWLKRRLGQR